MTESRPGGHPRSFGSDELADVEGIRPDELAAEARLARDLEGVAARGSARASADFADRVMAAVAKEPLAAPVAAAGAALRRGALGGFLASLRDAWRVTVSPSFPMVVRAQALALVLVAAGLAAGGGMVTAGALGLLDPARPAPAPSVEVPSPAIETPSESVEPTDGLETPGPSESPEPSASGDTESAEPSDTPEDSGSPEASEPPDGNGGSSGSGGGTVGSGTPEPTHSQEPDHTPSMTATPSPTDAGGGEDGSTTPEPSQTPNPDGTQSPKPD